MRQLTTKKDSQKNLRTGNFHHAFTEASDICKQAQAKIDVYFIKSHSISDATIALKSNTNDSLRPLRTLAFLHTSQKKYTLHEFLSSHRFSLFKAFCFKFEFFGGKFFVKKYSPKPPSKNFNL